MINKWHLDRKYIKGYILYKQNIIFKIKNVFKKNTKNDHGVYTC